MEPVTGLMEFFVALLAFLSAEQIAIFKKSVEKTHVLIERKQLTSRFWQADACFMGAK
jgi:hypothetical protein